VVLTGENGAGKTNLLEAVSLLSPGRGLRRAPYQDIARGGSETGFVVHARVEGEHGEVEIGTAAGNGGDPSGGEGGRRIRLNGEPSGADELLDHLRVMWLTPSMDALFTGPAGDRRRFLDRLVLAIDPAHGRRALDYEKAMRGRNRLLAEDTRNAAWFDAIEAQMAEAGTAIAAARMELVRLLTAMIARLPEESPFPRSSIGLSGTIDSMLAERAAVDVEQSLREMLSEGRNRDRAAGRTLEGPHRSDLVVRHGPKDMPAELCSTGEQKALLVGLILSQARLTAELSGITPILLLDEIAAHLDAGRRAALFSILAELGGQAFLTGTDAELFSALDGRAQFLEVRDGGAAPASG
jgi:DNA replication and repair protein RecF